MRFRDIIKEDGEDPNRPTLVLLNFRIKLKDLLGKSRTNQWDPTPTGHPAFRHVYRRQLLQIKNLNDSYQFTLAFGSNSRHEPMVDMAQLEDAFTKANESSRTIYVSMENGRPSTDRQGRISGPVPVRFTISTNKLPDTTFAVGGNSAVQPGILQQIRNEVPKEATNGYGYLKDIKSDGDNIVIRYAYTMAGLKDRHPMGGPSHEYDAKIIAAMQEYQDIAKALSAKYNVNVIPKEVAY
jgi:hypothetical protein